MAKTKARNKKASKPAAKAVPAALQPFQPILRPWLPWLSALILFIWGLFYILRFQFNVMPRAYNSDGGVLFGESVFSLGYALVVCAAFARGAWKRLHPLSAALSGLVPWFFIQGTASSSGDLFTLAAIPFYVAANVFCFAGALGEAPAGGDRDEERADWAALAWPVLIGIAAGILVWKLREWTLVGLKVPSDKNSLGMLYISRAGGGATDIAAGPFTAWGSLIWPAAWFVLAAAAAWFWKHSPGLKSGWVFWGLAGLALLGKLAISAVSHQGLGILATKIASINTHYYELVKMIEDKGLFSWLKTYNEFQLAQSAHGDTHPPGPVLLYWVFTRILGHTPWLVALAMAALCSLTAPLLYQLARDEYKSEGAGFAAALLYVSTPVSFILSSAGIDAVVALILVLGLRAIQRSYGQGSWVEGLKAGAWFGLGSFFSFGLPLSLMFAGLWTLHHCLLRRKDWATAAMKVLLCWGPLLGAVAGVHLLWWAVSRGGFSYTRSLGAAQFIHQSMNQYRTYELWSWGNVVLFAGYAGLATLGAFLVRAFSAAWRLDNRDAFLMLSVPFVLTLIFSCMGRGEVQREFLYGIVFLAVPAARLLVSKDGLRLGPAVALLALNTAGAAVLEMYVLDYW